MEDLTTTLKKAFYLGVGLASYAGEQASDFQGKALALAEDLIRRGEGTTEEASKFFNTWIAQSPSNTVSDTDRPQKIEILSVEDVDVNEPNG